MYTKHLIPCLFVLFLASPVVQADLFTGLQAYYSFDTDATDQHGNFDGTVVGATKTSSGLIGGAYQFTGNQHIDVGSPLATGNNARSYSMWVNPTGSNDTVGLFHAGSDGSGNDFTVWLERRGAADQNHIYLRRFIDDVRTQPNQTFDNSWHHVVVSYDGTTSHNVDFYVDGVNLNVDTGFSTSRTFNTALITQSIGGNYQPSDSIIDEVGVWNRSLTAQEVSDLYNGGLGFQFTAVPEPSSLMCGAMMAGLLVTRRRRRKLRLS